MSTGCHHGVKTHKSERSAEDKSLHIVTGMGRQCKQNHSHTHIHRIINYDCILDCDLAGCFYFMVCILSTVLYKSWQSDCHGVATHISTHRVFPWLFTVIALCLRGLRGSWVCPVRERSGLKGSLSTYTPTENQSIVRGAGLGVREGERREKELRLFQGSTRVTEIL